MATIDDNILKLLETLSPTQRLKKYTDSPVARGLYETMNTVAGNPIDSFKSKFGIGEEAKTPAIAPPSVTPAPINQAPVADSPALEPVKELPIITSGKPENTYQTQMQAFNTNFLNKLQNMPKNPFEKGTSALDYVKLMKEGLAIPQARSVAESKIRLFGDSRDDLLAQKLSDKSVRIQNEAVAPLMNLAQATVPIEMKQPMEKYNTDVDAANKLLSTQAGTFKETDANDIRNPMTQANLLSKKAGVLSAMSTDELNKAHANYYNKQVENEKGVGSYKSDEWKQHVREQEYLKKNPEEAVEFGASKASPKSVKVDGKLQSLPLVPYIPRSKQAIADQALVMVHSKKPDEQKVGIKLLREAGLLMPSSGALQY